MHELIRCHLSGVSYWWNDLNAHAVLSFNRFDLVGCFVQHSKLKEVVGVLEAGCNRGHNGTMQVHMTLQPRRDERIQSERFKTALNTEDKQLSFVARKEQGCQSLA